MRVRGLIQYFNLENCRNYMARVLTANLREYEPVVV